MNPKETTESLTFLLPSFSDFFKAVPLQQFSLDGKVRNEVRDMGQGVTQVDYLKAYGPIGLGVALTIDDDEKRCTDLPTPVGVKYRSVLTAGVMPCMDQYRIG